MEWVQIDIEGIKQTCIQYLEFHKPISPEVIGGVTVIGEYESNSTSVSTTAPILDSDSVTKLLQLIVDVSCVDDCNHNGDCVYGKSFNDIIIYNNNNFSVRSIMS